MTTRTESSPLLEVRDLEVSFVGGRKRFFKGRHQVHAVQGVSFTIDEGSTVGLVGESGSGKSTIGRAILQLVRPSAGSVYFRGQQVSEMHGRDLLPFRRNVQVVFQDPHSSLNPSMTVGRIVGEALDVAGKQRSQDQRRRLVRSLELVGLTPEMIDRYPHEFSGGQRQRIAIARALAVEPALIVCDEAVSALDVSTQAQIIELLLDIQRRTGVAYLFISHDLSVVRYMSDYVLVMNSGRILEQGPPERVYTSPAHPYTANLIAAVPDPHPGHRSERSSPTQASYPNVRANGTRPLAADDLAAHGDGCPYRHRCTWAFEPCVDMPTHTPVTGGGTVACHLQSSGPRLGGRPLAALDAIAGQWGTKHA